MRNEAETPELRIRFVNEREINTGGKWVLYWMTAFRRTRYNFALQHARNVALELGKPLVILEALRVHYRWACDRFHRFVIEGMRDNAVQCDATKALYYPYVEPRPGEGSGLVEALAVDACLVVTDDYPCFFHPRMMAMIGRRLPVSLVAIDSNCLMPLNAMQRTFTVAHSYRRFMQKALPEHLSNMPEARPLDSRRTRSIPSLERLPESVERRWPRAEIESLLAPGGLSHLPINHAVSTGAVVGGCKAAEGLLSSFTKTRLSDYASHRNYPDKWGSSELSPHLHFGHISPHEVFAEVMQVEAWHPGKLLKPNGKINGFWGVSESGEAFLDQLCTWREIGFNMCWREANYDRFESLPDWAQQTLEQHQHDIRPEIYSLPEFEQARTHDPIWNAAQRQLVREGRIHNYMRMLWGKKILHWSPTPRQALQIMIELNNKYGLDGRDPNSYSGIFWVLGRYDRAWGPEREVFGKIRYMTSDSTARKFKLDTYLQRYAT